MTNPRQSPTPSGPSSSELEWLLVLCTKRSWTALSVAVLSAVAWVLLAGRLGRLDSPAGWLLVLLSVGSGTIWVRAQQTIFRLRRLLGRPTALLHLGL